MSPARAVSLLVRVALLWLLGLASLRWQAPWVFGLVFLLGVETLITLRPEAGTRSPRWVRGLTSLALAALLVPAVQLAKGVHARLVARADEATIEELVASEERILELTPGLKRLAHDVFNLELPGHRGRNQFAEEIELVDLDATPTTEAADGAVAPVKPAGTEWMGAAEVQRVRRDNLALWGSLLGEIEWFEDAKFYLIDGHFVGEGLSHYEGKVGFSGLARTRSGLWIGLSGKQSVTWVDTGVEGPSPDEPRWRIARWETLSLSGVTSPRRLFSEAVDSAVRGASDRAKLRRSQHQEAAVAHYLSPTRELPHPYFAPISANQKPGIAVADIDSDGDDDIYVTVRIGRNLLLENRGDGTFVEAAALHGLNFTGHSTCALFADFDNDGDPDLFLGRSLRSSLYFVNENGWFHPGPEGNEFPLLAISASAADFNSDGLLDLYLLTYRPATIGSGDSPSGGVAGQSDRWPDAFFEPEMAEEYYRRHRESNQRSEDSAFPNLLDQIGPPNVLYVNRGGGRFEPAPEGTGLDLWRNSLQATWSDYDRDGDPDLYVANDWAPDNFFRNDGADGFTDITADAGTTAFGFAMGVSWGDYDLDGAQDLYVSNMFSKAGTRITRRLAELDPTYAESADGNYLYRQRPDGGFDLVSGTEPPSVAVANGGWAWGGQFADFDNDQFPDLYVLSGYFTAPKTLASELDL